MKPRNVLLIALIALGLAGCATPGHRYDDSRIARISRGATTEAELVDWFGSPNTRVMAPDGNRTMSWKFGSGKLGSPATGKLEVRLDADGKVVAYSASTVGK